MKHLIKTSALIIMSLSVFAQSPEKMSYQAIIRNQNNALVVNTQIGMQISIVQGAADGTSVYVETQTPSTNNNGLVSIEIGSGTVITGNFATVDWANGPYFIKTETDPTGGTSYSITGTSQLLSVPYALHAKHVENDMVDDADHDPANEIQQLSVTDNQISISGGNTITINTIELNDLSNVNTTNLQTGDILTWNGTEWVTARICDFFHYYYIDLDNDNYGNSNTFVFACSAPLNYVLSGGDCNDSNTMLNPGITEICDGIDNNCDGQIDEGFTLITYYRDEDEDGYGVTNNNVQACSRPNGYIELPGDCDDTKHYINPGMSEIPGNLIDDDCDGYVD